ncbi:MAG: hypothetical protein JW768_10910 [Chitinispirillaceae bacterium]|nr:hypothetical protein [Chitinispirillaceae bacterium]
MKKLIMVAAVLMSAVVIDGVGADAGSGSKALSPQTTCPVMGGKIDTNLYVNYKDKRIYVCCAGCTSAVAKDPEKHIRKLEKMGEKPEVVGKK